MCGGGNWNVTGLLGPPLPPVIDARDPPVVGLGVRGLERQWGRSLDVGRNLAGYSPVKAWVVSKRLPVEKTSLGCVATSPRGSHQVGT